MEGAIGLDEEWGKEFIKEATKINGIRTRRVCSKSELHGDWLREHIWW